MVSDSTLPRVCVSILNWNNYAHTIRCLESVQGLDYPNYYVVVVDNASTNDSVAQIKTAFPEIKVLEANSNLGYAGGNELALKHAIADGTTDLFWILNNDTRVTANTLLELVNAYNEFGLALYGGVPLKDDEGEWRIEKLTFWKFLWGQRLLIYSVKLNNRLYSECFPSLSPQVVNNVHGSHMMIPIKLVETYGYMDTNFFLYGEELEYSERLKASGIKTILVPSSVVFHVGGGTGENHEGLFFVAQYYLMRNRLIFFKRYIGVPYVVFQVFLYLFKILQDRLAGKSAQARSPLNTRYRLLGMRDGILGRTGKILAPEDFLSQTRA